MDVVSVFLVGDIDEEIYTEQPEGFEQREDLVCLLNNALYGLKQAPRVWNQ
jgi:Reverse transcriptase (RNA-dependent DNA polymerase)